MTSSPSTWAHAALTGSAASLLSAAVLAVRGRREIGRAAAPIDAVSHWVHGEEAYRHDEGNLRHTAVGFGIHHASSLFWALLYARLLKGSSSRRSPARPWLLAAGVTGLAAVTDLRLVPERLTPGFQHRLRPSSVALTYVGFGLGLALAGALLEPRRAP